MRFDVSSVGTSPTLAAFADLARGFFFGEDGRLVFVDADLKTQLFPATSELVEFFRD